MNRLRSEFIALFHLMRYVLMGLGLIVLFPFVLVITLYNIIKDKLFGVNDRG